MKVKSSFKIEGEYRGERRREGERMREGGRGGERWGGQVCRTKWEREWAMGVGEEAGKWNR